jgi:D-serine deaminase-like pyridoxal phosphate-dependent protein
VPEYNYEIYSLNEEHAFLRSKEMNHLQIGDKIEIIPNHACVVTNLVDEAYGFRAGRFDHMIPIDARGKSV